LPQQRAQLGQAIDVSPRASTRVASAGDFTPINLGQARKDLDTTLGRRFRVAGRGDINVTVKSKGQQSVSQVGPFRKVRVSRMTQMEPASQGPQAPAESGGGDESQFTHSGISYPP
jgi:hypothetical protein